MDIRNTPDLPFVCNGCGVLVKDPSERVLEDPRGYCEQCLDESDKATVNGSKKEARVRYVTLSEFMSGEKNPTDLKKGDVVAPADSEEYAVDDAVRVGTVMEVGGDQIGIFWGDESVGIEYDMPSDLVRIKTAMKRVAIEDIGSFLDDYLACALWSSTDIFEGAVDQVNGDPLDKHFDTSNIAEESKQKAQKDCESFLQQVEAAGLELNEDAGHDFWLTRNGHGAGFWDGDYEKEVGQKLTDIAKSFGEANPYVGDDGQAYIQ
jgi:hypothetical protein